MCFALGWSGGPIAVDITYNYQMYNCYKVMLSNMGNWKTAWEGADSKWLDACEAASSGGDIAVKTWELSSEAFSHDILGGTNTDSTVGCVSLF